MCCFWVFSDHPRGLLTKWCTVSGFTFDSLLSTTMRRPVGPKVSWRWDGVTGNATKNMEKTWTNPYTKPALLLQILVSSRVNITASPRSEIWLKVCKDQNMAKTLVLGLSTMFSSRKLWFTKQPFNGSGFFWIPLSGPPVMVLRGLTARDVRCTSNSVDSLSYIWGCPKMGVPPNHPF